MDLATEKIIKRGEHRYEVTYGDDAGLLVEFYMGTKRLDYESEQQGREIYKDIEMLRITCPGKPVRSLVEEVTEAHKKRFPRQYDAFKRQEQQVAQGTPLSELTFLSRGQVLNYKSHGLHTVEQLAALPDTGLEALGLGGRDLREKARLFLGKAAGNAELSQLHAENKRLKEALDAAKNFTTATSQAKETPHGKKS
jgi:hypothetical protein